MACPYAAHAPASVDGAAVWAAANASVRAGMTSLEIDLPGALAMATGMGAHHWAACDLIAAFRGGMFAGLEARREAATDRGGGVDG